MKKKGFTLVELLAVIVVLSILTVIVIIYANGLFKDRVEEDYDNIIKMVIENTKTMIEGNHEIADSIDTNIKNYSGDSNACVIDYQALVDKNLMDKDIKNPKTNKSLSGYIVVRISPKYEYLFEFKERLTYEEEKMPDCLWNSNTIYVVSFDSNGVSGIQVDPVEVKYWGSLPKLTVEIPAREGYTFKGWYDASVGGSQYYNEKGINMRRWDKYRNTTLYAQWRSNNICRRAASDELHTWKATSTVTHIYGQVGTAGQLSPGDAFVCDINGDEEYDPETEMFYYVSDYYRMYRGDWGWDSSVATLIYYTNVYEGMIDNTMAVQYSSEATNKKGPQTAIKQLPTTAQWPGVELYKTARYLLYDNGGYKAKDGTYSQSDFWYGDYDKSIYYAARLLSYQELVSGCPAAANNQVGAMSNCKYLIENGYQGYDEIKKNYVYGYWLETPAYDYTDRATTVLINNGYAGSVVSRSNVGENEYYGVRPVIDVKKENINY